MSASSLGSVYESTCEALRSAGLDEDEIVDLVAARLVVERVGDSENLGWWDSFVLDETGRDRLNEVAEKTHFRARVDLAQKVGRKVESERLPDDAVSLFSFGPRYESRVTVALDEIDADADVTFEELEALSLSSSSIEEGWTTPIIGALGASADDGADLPEPEANNVLRMEEGRELTEDDVEEEARVLLVTFLRGYGKSTGTASVPYYPLTAGLETIGE